MQKSITRVDAASWNQHFPEKTNAKSLEQHRNSFGTVLEHIQQYWNSTETVLEQYWNSIETVLKQYWSSTGAELEQYWDSTETVLEQY